LRLQGIDFWVDPYPGQLDPTLKMELPAAIRVLGSLAFPALAIL